MKKKIIIFSSIGGAILIGLTILILCLCLNKVDKSYRSIKVFKVDGVVNVVRDNKSQTVSKDMKLKNNDVVEVKEKSSTVLKLDNDKFVMAKENTTLRLIATGKKNNTKTRILVDKGGVIVEVKEKLKDSESFEIASSNSVMAIRGTQVSFDVEVKDNKITTSFAILEGNTEILLFKNEKLSSTTLTKDFRMSYTTDVTEVISTEDISKLIDKVGKTVDVINDNDLKEVFNAVKEELTSEEIDSIVDTINEFEREEKVNGVIKFEMTKSPIVIGENPMNYIKIEDAYKDLIGLKYAYSKTIDGEYNEFDEANPLDIGTWYCKITAGNAYRSDPLEFSISSITLSVDGNVSYATNPMEFIKSDSSKTNLKYEYSDSIDGEYKEFDSNDPFDLGTWYCRVVSDSLYISNVLEITIVEKELDIKFEMSQYVVGNTGYIRTSFSDLEEFFTSDVAQTPSDGTDIYDYSDYQYYVLFAVSYTDGSDGGYTYYLDYSHRDVINETIFVGEPAMNVYYSIKLPYGYKSILDQTNDRFDFTSEITVNEMYIEQSGDNFYLYAFVDAYSADLDHNLGIIYTFDDDNTEYGVIDYNNEQYHCYVAEIPSSVKSFKFVLVNSDDNDISMSSKSYSFDANNFMDPVENNASLNASYNGITTYNEDGTINIYHDIEFSKETENNFVFFAEYRYKRTIIDNKIYTEDRSGEFRFVFVSGDSRFAACEDLANEKYDCIYTRVALYDDEIYYIPLQPILEPNTTFNGLADVVSYGAVGGTATSLTIYSNAYFIKGNEYTIYDSAGNVIGTVTEEDFTSDHSFEKTIEGITPSDVYISGNAYGYISQAYQGSEDIQGAFTDLDAVKELLKDANITIKGTNIRPLDHMRIQMG